MYLNMCEDTDFLAMIIFIKNVIEIIQIVIPIFLIIMCTIDLVKQVLNTEEKSYQKIVKRMIAAVTVFFLPTLVSIVLELAGASEFSPSVCWANANSETVQTLKSTKESEEEAKKQAKEQQEAKDKQENNEIKESQKTIEENKDKIESNTSSSTLLKENGEDGKVTVVDGVFYKPSTNTSGSEGTKGSGPYGYNIYFFNRLEAFVQAAKLEGYTISYSTNINGGAWRDYENQEYFWNCYKTKKCNNGNLAAKPGTSNHGWGIASDMKYGSKAAKDWAHRNASKYGLNYSVCNDYFGGNCKEDWHIEPTVVKKK